MHSDRHVIEHLLPATLIKVYTTHYSPHVILAQVSVNDQVPVFQKLDNAIQRINQYPADKYYGKQLRYPLDRLIYLARVARSMVSANQR